MQPSVVLVVVIVVVVLVVGVAVARAAGGSGSPPPSVGEVPEDTMFQVRQLLGEGKKLQAIKVFRESQPGMGLKDAKEYVEALQAGHEPAVAVGRSRAGGSHQVELGPDLLFRIRQLLGENKKIQAIKELRDGQPGMGLKEAKDLVEAIEGGYEPPVTAAEPPPEPQVPAAPSDLAARVRELRGSGQETLAIRLVCDETGMGILDAQKFVRSLD
jgi:ribosomal protein L7/L12